jgi:hypothetical protein
LPTKTFAQKMCCDELSVISDINVNSANEGKCNFCFPLA